MKVSVNAVWDETLAFIRAERALIIPLSLGTIYLASIVAIAAALLIPAVRGVPMLIAAAWGIVGQFALVDLVLEPRRSVREALGKGAQVLPYAILIYFMLGAVLLLLSLPLVYAIMKAGYTAQSLAPVMANQAETMKLVAALPGWFSLYSLALFGLCAFVFVRLLLWKPALTLGGRPIEALKQSWVLTRGRFWPLFGLMLFAGLVMELVEWALSSALGAVFILFARGLGVWTTLIPLMIVALASTAFQTILTIFIANYYRRTTF
jgi:hypothetical protein